MDSMQTGSLIPQVRLMNQQMGHPVIRTTHKLHLDAGRKFAKECHHLTTFNFSFDYTGMKKVQLYGTS